VTDTLTKAVFTQRQRNPSAAKKVDLTVKS